MARLVKARTQDTSNTKGEAVKPRPSCATAVRSARPRFLVSFSGFLCGVLVGMLSGGGRIRRHGGGQCILAITTPKMIETGRVLVVDQWDEPGFTENRAPSDKDQSVLTAHYVAAYLDSGWRIIKP